MAKGKYAYWLTDDGLLRIQGWARDGLTDEQIAKEMRIGSRTLYEWKKKYPQIMQALKESKDAADRQVENALFNAALEGNTTAQIFWLKNRKPAQWRDQPKIKDSDNDNVLQYLDGMRRKKGDRRCG